MGRDPGLLRDSLSPFPAFIPLPAAQWGSQPGARGRDPRRQLHGCCLGEGGGCGRRPGSHGMGGAVRWDGWDLSPSPSLPGGGSQSFPLGAEGGWERGHGGAGPGPHGGSREHQEPTFPIPTLGSKEKWGLTSSSWARGAATGTWVHRESCRCASALRAKARRMRRRRSHGNAARPEAPIPRECRPG